METATHRVRLIVLTIILALCFAGLGCRLVELQWARHGELRELAQGQHQHSYFREPPRGDIRDRRGNLLATSVPVKTICADPSMLKGHEAAMAATLAPLLQTNESHLLTLFQRQTRTNAAGKVLPNHYVLLKHKVSIDDWESIQAALRQQYTNSLKDKALSKREQRELHIAWLRSIQSRDDQIRNYPNGQLAAHILGFVGSAPTVWDGETNWITRGVEGIESRFDDKLRGARGWVQTERDIRRHELFVFRKQDVESRAGLNVVLTIDARIQQIVEEEILPLVEKHSPQSISVVVVRPRTGEILAMATLPTFDPNRPGSFPADSRRNRAIADTFEPGSTFKAMTLAGALNDGVARLGDIYDCENGYFYFAGKPLRDHEHYGLMTVEQIIARSSNIGTAKVAIRMGKERVYQYIREFGFGERTGVPLTGESPGILHNVKDWKPIHISRIPIGQGVAVTPLQMAMAMSAVANKGVLMRPMLVDRMEDEQGQVVVKYQPEPVRRVISEVTARQSTEALKSVVDKGTADKAALEHYTVAGKTGTAEKPGPGGYVRGKYYASFIGFFPTDSPELCIAVSIDDPLKKTGYYGGQVAAPVFKRIAERTANFLNIRPDIPVLRSNEVIAASALPEANAVTQVSRP